MKKIIVLLLLFSGFLPFSSGQNLVQNGDLEAWDNPNLPTDWDKAENITQATSPVHGGTYSAMHTSDESTKDLQQDLSGIIAGNEYNISYWYLDNDPEARTRIWSYWLDGDTYLDDHEEFLRANVYSTDNPEWQQFSVTLIAPPDADGFRFEVRVYKQDNVWGGSVYYDDFNFSQTAILPEPDNYPADFSAEASGPAIDLTWTDAAGAQLPSAYLVLGSDQDNISAPSDGNPVEDDDDLSDGTGALNIPYGEEICSFGGLPSNTTYYFKIYPYTNGGPAIDYKNDGTAPSDNASTGSVVILNQEDFNEGWGDWTTISVVGEQVWERDNNYGIDNTPCARMSGYEGGANLNDDWLVSPAMDFSQSTNEKLSFYTAMNYTGPVLEVKISTDYDGGGDPYAGTWSDLSGTLSPGDWEWTPSGIIDISGYEGESVYVAFKFTSTDEESATWEVDNILISGEGLQDISDFQGNKLKNVHIFPNPADDIVNFSSEISDYQELEIYGITGELIFRQKITSRINKLDLGSLEEGIYFMRLNTSDGYSITKRIILK